MAGSDVAKQITAVLQEYSYDVKVRVDAAAEDCAKGLRKDLKANSPSDGGEYTKSWAIKTDKEFTEGSKVYTAHNKRHYHLTHLLEKDHAGPYGKGSVGGTPHIGPAEKKWTGEFVELCEEACEG